MKSNTKSEEYTLIEFVKAFYPTDTEAPIHIELAGISYPDPKYHIRRNISNIWVIEYVLEGIGYVKHGNKVHQVTKDTIYLLHKGEPHNYYSDTDEPFSKIFLNVRGSICEQLISSHGLSNEYFFDGSGVKNSFEKILSVINSDDSDNEKQSTLQGIFIEILSRISKVHYESMHSEEALKLKDYLDSNLSGIVSAKELAQIIFRSPDYCLKLFKREFGITPYAYQLERKMQVAKSLLSDTHMSVGEIASTLGYSDLHYFSNLFKEKCGCRPLTYRKKER
ncbi:MAG: AraC family transcriptional regulator [Ruminococcaceae bacterium]|nr:AraC family transcriptional regulator [Oscillospiraceae bacterium]